MEMFDQKCAPQTNGQGWKGDCSTSVMDDMASELKWTDLKSYVENCVQTSGGYEGVSNSVFQATADQWNRYFPYSEYWPRITINEHQYHGAVRCPHPISLNNCGPLAAICAAYEPSMLPAVCRNTGCPFGQVQDECGVCGGDGMTCVVSKNAGAALPFIVVMIVFIVIGSVVLFFYIQRRLRSHDTQFTALQALYEPLQEDMEHGDHDTRQGLTTTGSGDDFRSSPR